MQTARSNRRPKGMRRPSPRRVDARSASRRRRKRSSARLPTIRRLAGRVVCVPGVGRMGGAPLWGPVPAVKPARPDLARVLQAGFRRASGSGRRTRDVFMVVEMALSVALAAVSALLIQSMLAIQQVPLGFDASNVFTLQFRLPQNKYPTPDDIARFFKTAIERVRAV